MRQSFDTFDLRQIRDPTFDSRTARAGSLFVALPGNRVNGAAFAREAAEKGATAILLDKNTHADLIPLEPQILMSENPSRDAALLAARFFAPGPQKTAGVTGTNGKTSVAWFSRQLLDKAGKKALCIGTLGLLPDGLGSLPALTSPDAISLHRTLQHAVRKGYDHLVIEASSHGLDQNRLDGLAFDVVAFTNLTQDHLDYHRTMDSYKNAKLRLMDLKKPGGHIITNADDPVFGSLGDWTYGIQGKEGKILNSLPASTGLRLITTDFDVELPLIGNFQGANVVCAWLITRALGIDATDILPTLTAVPGRMQPVAKHHDGGLALVDYAHTPDALVNALQAARAHTRGRLICVFGAGGNRDQSKRPLMGQAIKQLSDLAIITDDNPRFEDPGVVRTQILAACPDGIDIGNRRDAIAHALNVAKAGDLVLIAGKGHESGQTIGSTTRPFNDRDVTHDLANQSSKWTPIA